jgi:hypothetical protein
MLRALFRTSVSIQGAATVGSTLRLSKYEYDTLCGLSGKKQLIYSVRPSAFLHLKFAKLLNVFRLKLVLGEYSIICRAGLIRFITVCVCPSQLQIYIKLKSLSIFSRFMQGNVWFWWIRTRKIRNVPGDVNMTQRLLPLQKHLSLTFECTVSRYSRSGFSCWCFSLTSCATKRVPAWYPAPPLCFCLSPLPYPASFNL